MEVRKNMTQCQLADKLLVSDKTISKWETGVSHS
ncbi:MAG: helix-turn-helix domain-containing protein [Clostridium sp.]